MINTKDMARAIEWGIVREKSNGGNFVAMNTGSNAWNTQVKPLAEAIAEEIPGVKVSVNPDAPPDKRSYRANFDFFKSLAPNHQPQEDLQSTIREIRDNLVQMKFNDPDYRNSQFIRLKVISRLMSLKYLNDKLEWVF